MATFVRTHTGDLVSRKAQVHGSQNLYLKGKVRNYEHNGCTVLTVLIDCIVYTVLSAVCPPAYLSLSTRGNRDVESALLLLPWFVKAAQMGLVGVQCA